MRNARRRNGPGADRGRNFGELKSKWVDSSGSGSCRSTHSFLAVLNSKYKLPDRMPTCQRHVSRLRLPSDEDNRYINLTAIQVRSMKATKLFVTGFLQKNTLAIQYQYDTASAISGDSIADTNHRRQDARRQA